MRKRMKTIIIGCLIVMAVLFVGIFVFRKVEEQIYMREIENFVGTQTSGQAGQNYASGEVVCSVASEEEAQEVADKVDGVLKSYQDGMAVIGITQDVNTFLQSIKGRDDLPVMTPNYIYNMK